MFAAVRISVVGRSHKKFLFKQGERSKRPKSWTDFAISLDFTQEADPIVEFPEWVEILEKTDSAKFLYI